MVEGSDIISCDIISCLTPPLPLLSETLFFLQFNTLSSTSNSLILTSTPVYYHIFVSTFTPEYIIVV